MTRKRIISYAFSFSSYFRFVVSFGSDEVNSEFDATTALCSFPGFNEVQKTMCMEMPKSTIAMRETNEIFAEECKMQFQNQRWNCSGTAPPLAGDTPQELKRGSLSGTAHE